MGDAVYLFVNMHQFQCMLDGTVVQLMPSILIGPGVSQPNPTYSYWLRVDQLL